MRPFFVCGSLCIANDSINNNLWRYTMSEQMKQEFINKMEEKHPGKFKYHLIKYVNALTPVQVVCSKCESVSAITPNKLLSGGTGCLNCSNRYNYATPENFITRAKEVHGDKYGYDRVTAITKGTDKVDLYCPVHEHYFTTTATSHITKKSGCPDCGGSKQASTGTFAERAEAVHPGKYSYDDVVYVNNKTKVTVFCKQCNENFDITPSSLLQGHNHKHKK